MKKFMLVLVVVLVALVAVPSVLAGGPGDCPEGSTRAPGHCGRDGMVNGHYALEDYGGYDYVVNYRGDFGSDPYLDNGVIFNSISGDPGEHYVYRIVSEDNPAYTGDPDYEVWGTWEYQVLVIAGEGNIVHSQP